MSAADVKAAVGRLRGAAAVRGSGSRAMRRDVDLVAEAALSTGPEHSMAHLVTLRAIHDAPDNPQLQDQWSGRLQGMAMAGLVWRFPDGPWHPTAYGRQVIDATATDPRLVAIFGDPPEPLGIIVERWATANGYTGLVTERHPEGEWFGPDGASATGTVTVAWLAAVGGSDGPVLVPRELLDIDPPPTFRDGCCADRRKPCPYHQAYADGWEIALLTVSDRVGVGS